MSDDAMGLTQRELLMEMREDIKGLKATVDAIAKDQALGVDHRGHGPGRVRPRRDGAHADGRLSRRRRARPRRPPDRGLYAIPRDLAAISAQRSTTSAWS